MKDSVTPAVDLDTERPPWPRNWETRQDPWDAQACQRLWQAVLLSCLRTALQDEITPVRRPSKAKRKAGIVLAGWVGSREFHMVCALAGLEGREVLGLVERARGKTGGIERLIAQLAKVPDMPAEAEDQHAA